MFISVTILTVCIVRLENQSVAPLLSKDRCFIRYNTNSGMFVLFTGAEIRSVCTEAGMFAIRARRKMATEKDFLEAVNKVIKAYAKFSSTPRYMTYN